MYFCGVIERVNINRTCLFNLPGTNYGNFSLIIERIVVTLRRKQVRGLAPRLKGNRVKLPNSPAAVSLTPRHPAEATTTDT